MTAEGAEEEATKEPSEVIKDEPVEPVKRPRPAVKSGEQVTTIGDKDFVAVVEDIAVECSEWVRSNYDAHNRILLDAFLMVMRSEGKYSAKPAEWSKRFTEFGNREV